MFGQLCSCPFYFYICILVDELALPARCQAAAVLGTVCQNNLKVQQDIFGKGALGRLVGIFESVEQHKLRTKVICDMKRLYGICAY